MNDAGRGIESPLARPLVERNGREGRSSERWSKVKRAAVIRVGLSVLIGFLLGRAVILSDLSPFAIPFFATAGFFKQKIKTAAAVSLLAGALTISPRHALYVLIGLLMFNAVRAFVVKLIKVGEMQALPYMVLLSGGLARLGYALAATGTLHWTDWFYAAVECGLSFLLTLIFLQSLPLVHSNIRKRTLKNEEIVCLIILLASVLTGTHAWTVAGLSIEHVLSRYFVLIFSLVAGAAIGSTVGVVIGLILGLSNIGTLYEMSLLAFSGLLGGLLKEGRKIGVALGLMVGTMLIGLYGEGYDHLVYTALESVAAIALFFMTPKSLVAEMARYIPGTQEYHNREQQYVKKLREVTASRVEQFSRLFRALSVSFSRAPAEAGGGSDREIDLFLSKVVEKTCQQCFLKETCWKKNFDTTYSLMSEIMQETVSSPEIRTAKLKRNWRHHCVKPDKVVNAIFERHQQFQDEIMLRKRVEDSRRLVADQLMGVSKIMGDFAKEIQKEREMHEKQEEQILYKLQEIGLDVEDVDIYNLEEGDVDIDMTIPAGYHAECEKIIAPILSDILGESIIIREHVEPQITGGFGRVTFGSAKAYVVETGASHTAQGGGWISGDNYTVFELGGAKVAIAISDGMGGGERAYRESRETLKLLSNVLKSGIDETVAIKSINSVLALRSTDEMFSTLDLAMIDLQKASAKFLKIGSNPSYIKRGDQVIKVEAGNLPMGIIEEVDIDVVDVQLKAGDLLVMMSDGLFDAPKNVENPDLWMKRKISEIEIDDPQTVADLLLEEVIRTAGGVIKDDMTVVVSKIDHHTPKWAAIPTYTRREERIRKAQ